MNVEELDREITKASISVTHNWPGVIQADDLAQELWLKILESPRYQDQMETSDPALRMEFLRRLGMQITGKEVSSYELFCGNVYYSTDHVRSLLESGLLTISRRDLGEMKETLTDFIDLHDALEDLGTDYARVVWKNYVEGSYNKNTSTSRSKLSRAVVSLTDLMNQVHRRRYAGYEDGLGTREIRSAARARAQTSNQWDGPRVF